MFSCPIYNEPTIDRGIYIDPTVQTLPKDRCDCCGIMVQVLATKVRKQLKINPNVDQVFDQLNIRGCCRAALLNDVLVSGAKTFFNPEREAGLIGDIEASEQEREGLVYRNWHGHMRRTTYRVVLENGVYYAVDPKTEERLTSYRSPNGQRVLEWLEIPIPNIASSLKRTAESTSRVPRGTTPKPTTHILVPRLATGVMGRDPRPRVPLRHADYDNNNDDVQIMAKLNSQIEESVADPEFTRFLGEQ